MKTSLSVQDRSTLDCLLTKMLGGLDGAIDFWTIVCIGNIPPDPSAFVLSKCEILRSLVVVTRTLLAEVHWPDKKPDHGVLARMYADCQKLEDSFLVLAQFRVASVDQIHMATRTVKEAYDDMRESIQQLAQSLDLSLSYWDGRAADRDEYLRRILTGLSSQFLHERESGELAPAASLPRA